MVLKLTPLVEPVINVDYDTLEELVKGMFQSRRKIIRHGAKSVHQNKNSMDTSGSNLEFPEGVHESCVGDNQMTFHIRLLAYYDKEPKRLPNFRGF